MKALKNFDATTVNLAGTNLIEASAGTGKTYSIAILVLRLVIEKKLPVKEILMVTFTKAAVAELEERIRLFIRKAYKASLGERIDDPTITFLVADNIAKSSPDAVQQPLRDAVLFLDETSVLTIHSFCQLTLTEFAFETSQLFGAETMQDTGAVIQDEINAFWRENITIIPPELLVYLIDAGLDREPIKKVVQEHLKGKKYFHHENDKNYTYCEEDHQKIILELSAIKASEEKLQVEMHNFITHNEADLRAKAASNHYSRNAEWHLFNHPEELVNRVRGKKDKGYTKKLFAEIITRCDDCDRLVEQIALKTKQVINDINCQAINAVSAGMDTYKQRNNMLSFDDMIVNLHRAFTGGNCPALVAALQKKYKAVFVDEFQDTDRLQYEIFQKAFGQNTMLFYIGDPKQSIYAFRKADIFTYFKAKEEVAELYTMNTNFRSSAPLIEAMNVFFQPQPAFDTFYFGDAPEAILYHQVESPKPNGKGVLSIQGVPAVPVTITSSKNNPEILQAVVAQVAGLLSDPGYKIRKNNEDRGISPSDIGVLVRTRRQARDVKSILARYGIPAVTIDDAKVLQSPEATWLLYLLQAMADVSHKAINKALLSPFTGYQTRQLLELDDEVTLALFRNYRTRWLEDGVYTALIDFVADFNVKTVLLHAHTEAGERVIATMFQLIELLHKVQNKKQFSPPELISWLKRGIEGMETEGDEYEQRIESDDESVNIITIHRSKGLEYNIVIAPYLDFVESKKAILNTYRNPVSGDYISIEKDTVNEDQRKWITEQNEQENRRLIYVAVTRAVYACFINHSTHHPSTLTPFLTALHGADPRLIKSGDALLLEEGYRYRVDTGYKPPALPEGVRFTLQHNSWTKMSYTMLAKKSEPVSRPPAAVQAGAYDLFMFTQLTRGSKTGNLLHQVFENASFSDDRRWMSVIDEALQQHLPRRAAQFAPMLYDMLQQTFNLPLTVNGHTFRLSEVAYDRRIHEFEFDFPVPLYNPAALNNLSDANIDVRVSWDKPLEGIVNGKLDLFFGLGDKYYILDWKSNYLGDTLADYSPLSLARAMNDNNYHLQYLIYTLAVKKYLHTRLKNFDYELHFGGVIYLFVRGIRSGSETGVYVNRPTFQQVHRLEDMMAGSVQAI